MAGAVQKSDIQKYMWVYINILSKRMLRRKVISIQCHFDATMLINKHFAVFLKTIHTEEVHHRNLCKAENGEVRRRRGAQISYSSLFSIRIVAYRYVLPIEINRSYQRALAYTCTWHGRLSEGIITVNTSRGRLIHLVGGWYISWAVEVLELQNSEICAGRHRLWLATHRTRSCWDGRY